MEQQNAKFAFYYMLSLVALVFTALSTGMIIFQIINKLIPDPGTFLPGGFDQGILKFAIAAIIIAGPIYFVTSYLINSNLISGKLSKDSGVRKWLTYFILFVSSVVVIGWLIAIIFNFLDGEWTIKFILKAITAIIIAALIFTYYLYDIRQTEIKAKNKIVLIYFYGAIAIAAISLIASMFIVESPVVARNKKFDNAILNRFVTIDNAINSYYVDHKKMPDNLDQILNQGTYYITAQDLTDPVTSEKFNYQIKSKDTYEICATFKTSNKDENDKQYSYVDSRWRHDTGYQCLIQKLSDIKEVK